MTKVKIKKEEKSKETPLTLGPSLITSKFQGVTETDGDKKVSIVGIPVGLWNITAPSVCHSLPASPTWQMRRCPTFVQITTSIPSIRACFVLYLCLCLYLCLFLSVSPSLSFFRLPLPGFEILLSPRVTISLTRVLYTNETSRNHSRTYVSFDISKPCVPCDKKSLSRYQTSIIMIYRMRYRSPISL